MKILIVGAGVVGFHLAQELSSGKHDITVVDSNSEVIANVASKLDVMAVQGDGTDPLTLKKAGINSTEMIVAVSSSDESNLVICLLASKLSVPKKIARIRKEQWFKPGLLSKSELAIDRVINPTSLIISHIRKIIEIPGVVDVAEFSDHNLSLLGFRVLAGSPIMGKKLAELRENFSFGDFIIITIYRNHRMIIPTGDDFIQEGDTCYILTNQDMVSFVLPIFNQTVKPVNSIIVYGGNPTGILIAKSLEDMLIPKLVLIEPDKNKAEAASEVLTKTRVIYGDFMEPEIQAEINITEVDFFISSGTDPRSNLLISLLAKKRGAEKVIVITDETEYLPVLDSIGLNIVINPRLMIASEILKYIRGGRIHSVIKLKTGGVELIEQATTPQSKAVKKPIAKLNFPQGALIGAIIEDGNPIFPHGETVLKPGQEIILISRSDVVEKAEKFFL